MAVNRVMKRIVLQEEWKELERLLDSKAPWKKGLPFLQGVTGDDRAAYQGIVQGYQMALDVISTFVEQPQAKKLPAETYQPK